MAIDPPANVWRVVADALEIAEAAYGDTWQKTRVEFMATSVTQVTFRAADLVTLQSDFEAHGGNLHYVVIYTSYWDGYDYLQVTVFVWPNEEGLAQSLAFDLSGPVRVEVEGMGHSIRRSVDSLRGKKRWAQARVKTEPLEVRSDAQGSRQPVRGPVVRSHGLKTTLRRWFVLHRDPIIVSLGGGLLVSILVIVLQHLGILPVPH